MTKDAGLLESSFNSVLQEAPEGGLWQEDLATGRRGSITACHCLLAGWEGHLSMRGGTDVYSGSCTGDWRGPAGTRDSHLGRTFSHLHSCPGPCWFFPGEKDYLATKGDDSGQSVMSLFLPRSMWGSDAALPNGDRETSQSKTGCLALLLGP